jgi:hypothetical protein
MLLQLFSVRWCSGPNTEPNYGSNLSCRAQTVRNRQCPSFLVGLRSTRRVSILLIRERGYYTYFLKTYKTSPIRKIGQYRFCVSTTYPPCAPRLLPVFSSRFSQMPNPPSPHALPTPASPHGLYTMYFILNSPPALQTSQPPHPTWPSRSPATPAPSWQTAQHHTPVARSPMMAARGIHVKCPKPRCRRMRRGLRSTTRGGSG